MIIMSFYHDDNQKRWVLLVHAIWFLHISNHIRYLSLWLWSCWCSDLYGISFKLSYSDLKTSSNHFPPAPGTGIFKVNKLAKMPSSVNDPDVLYQNLWLYNFSEFRFRLLIHTCMHCQCEWSWCYTYRLLIHTHLCIALCFWLCRFFGEKEFRF